MIHHYGFGATSKNPHQVSVGNIIAGTVPSEMGGAFIIGEVTGKTSNGDIVVKPFADTRHPAKVSEEIVLIYSFLNKGYIDEDEAIFHVFLDRGIFAAKIMTILLQGKEMLELAQKIRNISHEIERQT